MMPVSITMLAQGTLLGDSRLTDTYSYCIFVHLPAHFIMMLHVKTVEIFTESTDFEPF